jgi:hypothetical protein
MRACCKLSPEAERELETLVVGLSRVLQQLNESLAPAAKRKD